MGPLVPVAQAVDEAITRTIWKMNFGVSDAQMYLNGNSVEGLNTIWQNQDDDGDGTTNGNEAITGTNPFDESEFIAVTSVARNGASAELQFPTQPGKLYHIESTTNLSDSGSWVLQPQPTPVQVTGDGGTQLLSVPYVANTFYRVRVQDADGDSDNLSDWVEEVLQLSPLTATTETGVNDHDYVESQLNTPNLVSIEATDPSASEDGPETGSFTITRAFTLMPATVNLASAGTAQVNTDYHPINGNAPLQFDRHEGSATVSVIPMTGGGVEGSESVTASIAPDPSYGVDSAKGSATVIISDSTTALGTGLLARIYDHANQTPTHAANFGDAANYDYVRAGTNPNFTGTAVISPTGMSSARMATLLAALTPNSSQVILSFLGGNLNTTVYSNQSYLVTAKTAVSFTVSLPPSAGLPASSTSSCNFSIQPFHPPLIERVDPVVNNDWVYGTPNALTISPMNSADNFSSVWETYLAPTTAGSYIFQLDADDRARVLLDTDGEGPGGLVEILEHGWDGATTPDTIGTFKPSAAQTLAVPASPGQRYRMRVEQADASGDARCRLQWNVNGGAFANIPQANQFTHTQALSYSYTAGNLVVTPTGGHSFAPGNTVALSFSSGALFTPGAASTFNGSYSIAAVNGGTTFTVPIPPTTVTLTGATTFAGSNSVNVPSVAGLYVGMSVTGAGLPANEFITAIGTSTITITTGTGVTAQPSTNLTCRLGGFPISVPNATTTAGSRTVLVPSIDGLAVGMSITGPGLPTNATISAVGPGMILLSTGAGVTAQASTTLTAFLHPTNALAGNGFVLNNSASTTTGVYNLIYPNTGFTGSPGRVGTSNAVTEQNNGVWGSGTPDGALINPETFSVRWSGQVQPQFTEDYTFIVQADDGCTLRLNGQVQEMRTLPSTQSGGSTYYYDSATGTTIVNYMGALIKAGSIAAGETVRVDPTNGNLNHPNDSTYLYDAATGVATVTYSNLTTVTPGGYQAGQYVELDPTAGTATSLTNTRYTILASPAPTTNTFAVSFGINAFASQTTAAAINITDNRDAIVTAVYAAGTGTYNYDTGTGNTVVTYTALGLPSGSITTGMNVLLDPSSGTISAQVNAFKTVTAHTATTFTVNYPGGSGNSTNSSIIIVAPSIPAFPAAQTTAFALALAPGVYANASIGNTNIDIVNKPLKDWSSMANERYVRLPVVGGTRYDIQLDYYDNTGNARAQLYWMSPSQPKQIIPVERLYPESGSQAPPTHLAETSATALVGGAFNYAVLSSNGAAITVSGLPPGLTFANGVISGTPTTPGNHQVLITLSNTDGTSTSVLNLQIEDSGGSVTREVWTGIEGTTISSIPLTTTPGSTADLTSLQAPTNSADNFGARIRGYLTAPATGNYYFWLSASDSAELWISNDDETINSIQRTSVSAGGATPTDWASAAKSPWLALEQGKRYYFELLHKSGTGAEHLALGWSKPGEPTTSPSEVVPGYVLSGYSPLAPGSTPGTLYVATLLSQNGAVTSGVGTATLRLSEDEQTAEIRVTYSGLSGTNDGPTSPQPVAADGSEASDGVIDPTDWHVHSDPYLTNQSYIIYDGAEPLAGDGPQFDNSGNFLYHKWNLVPQGTLSVTDIRELLKQGKAYINLHTVMYPNGEIRGNFTLANGSRTFSPPPAEPAWTDDSNTDVGAARFLTQASFGPNIADITALKALSPTSSSGRYTPTRYETWIDGQFGQTPSQTLPEVLRTRRADAQGGSQLDETLFFNSWWRNSISNPDQLRQRIAFALSEIHVISGQGPLDNRGEAIAYFYDKLNEGAFGNFREILETTTLTPAMGRYLDMRNNDKPDLTVGRIPNENYAREIKQLFSIGLYRMWPDGTLMLSSEDTPIDTYTQREIVGFAHVFTGWTNGYDGAYRTSINAPDNWMRLMREVPARHFTGPKRMLNNEVFPGLPVLGSQPLDPYATHNSTHFNQPAYQQLPAQELELSHDQLFNHPNTGPFICRQLIQRLVTSHPSRDYLYRVVQRFNDNGAGVRGDMQAVIKAILLDYEARSLDQVTKPAFGKQREPVLRVANAGRAFRPDTYGGSYAQSGSRTITIATTDGGVPPVAKAHKLATGNNVLLEFTAGSGGAVPWTGTYGVTVVDANTFTVQATGWVNGTYSIPANSNTCTVTMSNHWLQSGNQVFMDFTSDTPNGTVNGTAIDGLIYTISHSSTANNGDNGNSFTITVAATSTSARSGNCMIPRFRPGSMTIAPSGLVAPNDRRVTMRTEEDHHLSVGNQVQLNVYATQATPQPIDVVATVDSIVDVKTWTFLISSATTGWSNSQGNNAVYQFPLLSQPLSRSGTINSRSSTYFVGNTDGTLEQSPVNADTVFNYFLPEYKFPGALASQGITTPEFQLTAETTTVRQANFLYDGIFNPATSNGYSGFRGPNPGGTGTSSGENAVTMDYSAWITGNAIASVGLGAAPTTTVPWTHNQNIGTLIDHLSVLLTADQLSTATKSRIRNFVSQPIASITTGNPCTVNTNGPHGYTTGQTVNISGVAGGTFSPTLNSTSTAYRITVVDSDTFTMTGVNCTLAPSAGNLTDAHASQIIYNQGAASNNPSATERRDRFRAILHLILTSPDFTIQR